MLVWYENSGTLTIRVMRDEVAIFFYPVLEFPIRFRPRTSNQQGIFALISSRPY